ncbi:MAG: CvpA family protein [Spirochaetaceae bacterium]|nr:CvpA family protein [Spirochaetaceae bacterium]
MNFTIIDVFFAIIIFALAIMGSIKGFIDELFGKLAFVLGLVVAVLFYGKLYPHVEKWISVVFFAQAISFILLFIATFLLVKIIQHSVGSFFNSEIMNGLNRALGFFLGAFEGLLIVAVILIILNSQPWFDITALLKNSFFADLLSGFIVQPVNFVNERITV